eukprot:6489747-Prymnesium_polylepis.1
MALAYPEHRAKQAGKERTAKEARAQGLANVVVMLCAVGTYTLGSGFGPVSISVPAAMAGKLLWNLVFLWPLLRMQVFSKSEQVGTFVMVMSIVALPGVGPSDASDLSTYILERLSSVESIIWLALVTAATLAACVGMGMQFCSRDGLSPRANYTILLTAQVTSAILGTSTGKTFFLLSGWQLGVAVVLNGLLGVVNLVSMQIAATKTD